MNPKLKDSEGCLAMQSKCFNQTRENQGANDAEMEADEKDPLVGYLDGMGTATARIIINRHLDDNQWEKYGLKDLKNIGRYYIARIAEKNGKIIDEVLIDKQTGRIQSLRGQTYVGS